MPEAEGASPEVVIKHPPRCLKRSRWKKLAEWQSEISDKTNKALHESTATREAVERLEALFIGFKTDTDRRLTSLTVGQEAILGGAGHVSDSMVMQVQSVKQRVDAFESQHKLSGEIWKAILLLVIGAIVTGLVTWMLTLTSHTK